MVLSKTQKGLHITFRIIVFLTTILSFATFCVFVFFGEACSSASSSYYADYESVMTLGVNLTYLYYALLVMGVIAVIFSLICAKCTEVSTTVVRTISLTGAFVMNIIAIGFYNRVGSIARDFLDFDYYSLKYNYDSISGSDMESLTVLAVMMLFLSMALYIILGITSIVALAKKPDSNNYYQQQSQYSAQGLYNNTLAYGNQPQQQFTNPNMQGQPQQQFMNPNMQAQPQQQFMNPNMQAQPQQQFMNPNMQAQPQQQFMNPNVQGQPQQQFMNPDIQGQPQQQFMNPDIQAQPQQQFTDSSMQAQPQQETKVNLEKKEIVGYNPQTGEPIYSDMQNEN